MRAPALVVSARNESWLSREQRRYVGAQIGIDEPRGEKVRRVGRLSNREYLYVAVSEGVASARRGPVG